MAQKQFEFIYLEYLVKFFFSFLICSSFYAELSQEVFLSLVSLSCSEHVFS